ncbi:transcription factor bHLH92 [Olea europaea var. sylvestris]|uniref:Transcription factor bHLH92 n=1 Tax=Olea europaea subsp. europaea TaxID=158383 RepID=A0A8S0QZY1_OLEEU|nr:transcription factor bHLH92 [Olea europaea var. sylvestris]XP_022875095.1 transcription factor bHLH92 [Olea europaea var. sylvestris]CAA2971368.1 transcription factor bHLH92 [Olea europaea subsp. europaea]
MDEFFQLNNFWNMEWPNEDVLVNTSAFVSYIKQPIGELASKSHGNESNHRNLNKRMIEFLKTTSTRMRVETTIETENERNHKHMISERMRREKHKQSYLALHKLLPVGTKSDKNSILHKATKNIEDLQNYKEQLERRNSELEMVLAGKVDENKLEKALIKLKVAYPASGIDSMLEVLKCLENTGSKLRAIQSNFSQHEYSASLEIETKIRAADVEKAVQRTLSEVEGKFQSPFQGKGR